MAVLTFEQALELADRHWTSGQFGPAEALCRQILANHPQHAGALHQLGLVAASTGHYQAAVELMSQAIALSPAHAVYHTNLGEICRRLDRHEEAIACFHRALQLGAEFPETHTNLGAALTGAGRFEEAIACYHRALELRPDGADTHVNFGVALAELGRHAEATASFQKALIHKPELGEAHWNLALMLLLLEHYEEGWAEFEWRWRKERYTSPKRNFNVPQWNGLRADGRTILLHAEQGFGDALQFLRYVPAVRSRAGAEKVILECHPELARLLALGGDWDAEIIARGSWDGSALPPFDLHLPLLSLPFALKTGAPPLMSGPYLISDPDIRKLWRARLSRDPAIRVGLAWAGSPAHKNDRSRSIDFERLLPILGVPGVSFHSLQAGSRDLQSQARSGAGLMDWTAHITDFADTAALMAELDLIITVDTATAHLAGALGKPVWTLLPFVPDWRWGLEKEDTPWYPGMRLFRQPRVGDWESVIRRVAGELRALQAASPGN